MKARYTPRAVSDLIEIADYIRQFSAVSASKVRDEIQRTIDMLERFLIQDRVRMSIRYERSWFDAIPTLSITSSTLGVMRSWSLRSSTDHGISPSKATDPVPLA